MAALGRSTGARAVLVALATVLAVDAFPCSAQLPDFDPSDPVASFDAMGEYLTRDGGRWVAANPNYDGTESSPSAFGLWFERDVNGLFLELRIVIHFADRTVVSSRGHWAWHPVRHELTHVMVDRGGGVSEAVTTFADTRTFVTLATRAGADGNTEHRDENVIVSPDLHRNETFRRNGDEWVSGGVYEWRRSVDELSGWPNTYLMQGCTPSVHAFPYSLTSFRSKRARRSIPAD